LNKKKIQKSLENDSQTREWIRSPHMIVKRKIGVICFQPPERLQLNFFQDIVTISPFAEKHNHFFHAKWHRHMKA